MSEAQCQKKIREMPAFCALREHLSEMYSGMNRVYGEKQVIQSAVSGYSECELGRRGLDHAEYFARNSGSVQLRRN